MKLASVLDYRTKTTLSLAVELKDEFVPHLKPTGEVEVTLRGAGYTRTQAQFNRSGYYVFCDVPDGAYVVETKARYYLDASQEIKLPGTDPKNPVVPPLVLKPNPLYSFPEGSTLLKGEILAPDGKALPDVHIKVQGGSEESRTTPEGTFVLYFKEFVTKTVTLNVTDPLYGELKKQVDVRQDKVTTITLQYSGV